MLYLNSKDRPTATALVGKIHELRTSDGVGAEALKYRSVIQKFGEAIGGLCDANEPPDEVRCNDEVHQDLAS
jgi:hypothetical protein